MTKERLQGYDVVSPGEAEELGDNPDGTELELRAAGGVPTCYCVPDPGADNGVDVGTPWDPKNGEKEPEYEIGETPLNIR